MAAASVAESQEKYDLDLVDVALIKSRLPGESGLSLVRDLKFYLPAARIVVHTDDHTMLAQARSSFVVKSKSDSPETLKAYVENELLSSKPRRVQLGISMAFMNEREGRLTGNKRPRMLAVCSSDECQHLLRDLFSQRFQLSEAKNRDDAKNRYPLDTFDVAIVEQDASGNSCKALLRELAAYLPQQRLWLYTSDIFTAHAVFDEEWYSISKSTGPETMLHLIGNNMQDSWRIPLQRGWRAREKLDPTDKRPRLLVVDDEVDTCTMFVDTLSEILAVVTATSVNEALEKYDMQSFSVAIIDWHMPGESGLVLARMLRSFMPEQCIFLYSGDEAASKYENGSFRFVSKNIEPEELDKMVLAAALFVPKQGKFA